MNQIKSVLEIKNAVLANQICGEFCLRRFYLISAVRLPFLLNLLRTLHIAVADRAGKKEKKHNRPDNYESSHAQ